MSRKRYSKEPDIRWREVYATIKPYTRGFKGMDVVEIKVEIRWEGERFSATHRVENDPFYILDALDMAVEGIDKMLANHGHPPYKIRSK